MQNKTDEVSGVSECVILGAPMNLGTGMFSIMYDAVNRNDFKDKLNAPRTTVGKLSNSKFAQSFLGKKRREDMTIFDQVFGEGVANRDGDMSPIRKRQRTALGM